MIVSANLCIWGFSFFVAGVNDSSIGALTPYINREYNINSAIVSNM